MSQSKALKPKTSLRYELICDGAAKRYPNGRVACLKTPKGRAEYKRITLALAEKQGWVCGICKNAETHMHDDPYGDEWTRVTLEHADKRGAGGWRRNDTDSRNCAAHYSCNSELGSRRT